MTSAVSGCTRRTSIAYLLGGTLILAAPCVAAAEVTDARMTKAFVVSCSYAAFPQLVLANTNSDSDLIAATLRLLNVGTVTRARDPGREDFASRINAFVTGLSAGDVAFIYVSGHGVEIEGRNFLLLNDGTTFIDIQSVIDTVRLTGATLLLFLDTCRNNPFQRNEPVTDRPVRAVRIQPSGAVGDVGQKVTFEEIATSDRPIGAVEKFTLSGTGVKVVFATDPDNFAADSAIEGDANSPFAGSLAKRLKERASLDDVVAFTTGDVVKATEGYQSPWSQGSLGRPVFLAGRPKNKNPAKTPFLPPG